MLNSCIIGAGFAARLHAQAYEGAARIDGVADPDLLRAQALAQDFGCEAFTDAKTMLERVRPTIVSVCVPTFLHAQVVELAASFGCHALCEKPLALTNADCHRIETAGRSIKVMTAQVLRYWPEYRQARELFAAGRAGEIRFLHASRLLRASRGGWFRDAAQSGGALFDLMTHDTDYALWVLGGDVRQLFAVGRQNGQGAWSHVYATLRFENGAVATLEAGNDQPEGFPFTTLLRVSGDRGCVQVETGAEGNIGAGVTPFTRLTLLENGRMTVLPVTNANENAQERAFRDEVHAFVNAVREDRPCPIPLGESVRVIRLLNLIRQSLEERRAIDDVRERLEAGE